ncbi:MAG: polyhydroxyalkanoate granule-associated phasin [Gammaproteobacteria bacterium]
MKKSRSLVPDPFASFGQWTELALKASEMMVASSQVIAHRTQRMAQAGPLPNERDQREFSLMAQEKLDAARESSQAMATQMLSSNQRLGMRAYNQMLASATAMMSLASSSTPAESAARQARLARAVARSAATGTAMSRAAARVASRGLDPIHSRATANAKRLGKQSPKSRG